MSYKLNRYETQVRPDTNETEIFISVNIEINGGYWEEGYWLLPAEVVAVVADESALDAIVDTVAIRGEEALARALARPPVIPEERLP